MYMLVFQSSGDDGKTKRDQLPRTIVAQDAMFLRCAKDYSEGLTSAGRGLSGLARAMLIDDPNDSNRLDWLAACMDYIEN